LAAELENPDRRERRDENENAKDLEKASNQSLPLQSLVRKEKTLSIDLALGKRPEFLVEFDDPFPSPGIRISDRNQIGFDEPSRFSSFFDEQIPRKRT